MMKASMIRRGVGRWATILASLVAVPWAAALQAGVNQYDGSTFDGPTYNRMEADCVTNSVFDGSHYHLQPFTVSADGDYVIHSEQSYDGYIFVYQTGFDADAPVVNCMAGNDDDSGGIGTSELTATLTAGTEYLLVTTEYSEAGGTFTNTFSGPGEIVFGASYVGSLGSSDPVYDRPQPGCVNQSHPDTAYELQPFVVDTDGTYAFTSSQRFDGFLALYTSSFNHSQPFAGCTVASDDGFNGIGTSSFSANLTAGVSYVLVTAGYDDAAFGSYTNTIAGPGHVAPGGVTYTGSTVGAPTFNRTDENCILSGFGTAVGYSVQSFTFDYVGLQTVGSTQDYDGFLSVYQMFDSANPELRCYGANDDDYPGIGSSRVVVDTTFGFPFAELDVVTSAYDNSQHGRFVNTIEGPHRIALANQSVGYDGTTVGAPTFTRPSWDDCSRLTGIASPYQATTFSVSVSGNYAIHGYQESGYDGYLLLYEAPFNPGDGTANCLDGSDNGGDSFFNDQSAFIAAPLKAFHDYVLVTTAADNSSGTFTNYITGPGSITLGEERIFANGFDP